MIASHELNFFKLIFKRLYVVLVSYKLTITEFLFLYLLLLRLLWLLPLLFLICLVKVVVVVIDWSLCLAAFTVFVCPLIAVVQLRCEDIFALSLNKHEASPWSRNCKAIHAIIESLIRPFVINSYYSEILKSCHTLVIVCLEIGVVW